MSVKDAKEAKFRAKIEAEVTAKFEAKLQALTEELQKQNVKNKLLLLLMTADKSDYSQYFEALKAKFPAIADFIDPEIPANEMLSINNPLRNRADAKYILLDTLKTWWYAETNNRDKQP